MDNNLDYLVQYLKNLDCSSHEYKKNYVEILKILKENFIKITFIKEGGEEREMICTRNGAYISEFYCGPQKCREERLMQLKRDQLNRLVRVFDVELNQFRSFKIDRLIDAEHIE